MSVAQELESRVVANLESSDPSPVGFNWAILISTLLPVLTDLLSGCLSKRGPDAVSEQLSKGSSSFWNRYAVRRAMRQATKELGIKKINSMDCCEMVLSQLETVDAAALVAEIDDNVSNWDLV